MKANTRLTSGAIRVGAWALIALCCVASPALAQDAVKLSELWVQPVTVLSIDGGMVRYENASGDVLARPVKALQGMRLGRYPALAGALDAIDQEDDATAAALLGQVVERAKEPWARWYAQAMLVRTHERLGDADAAAGVYIDMVSSGAEQFFIAEPPADAVAAADPPARLRVSKLARAALETVGPDRRALLQELIDAAGNPSAQSAADNLPGDAGSNGQGADAVVLSASVPPGPVVTLLKRGRPEQALLTADRTPAQPGRTASNLYLKGMAQLATARRSQDEDGIMSAGLDFMRVVVYYPRSAVAGPATLEAGYVHQLIGRNDIAKRMYQRARPLIDEQEDPAYYKRMNELIAGLATDQPDE
jgi:hypothetical protein